MSIKSLSSELATTIEVLETLSEAAPQDEELNEVIQRLYDELQTVESKEWEESIIEYKEAKSALEEASRVAQEAIIDLSKTANAVSKVAKAIGKLAAAVRIVV